MHFLKFWNLLHKILCKPLYKVYLLYNFINIHHKYWLFAPFTTEHTAPITDETSIKSDLISKLSKLSLKTETPKTIKSDNDIIKLIKPYNIAFSPTTRAETKLPIKTDIDNITSEAIKYTPSSKIPIPIDTSENSELSKRNITKVTIAPINTGLILSIKKLLLKHRYKTLCFKRNSDNLDFNFL